MYLAPNSQYNYHQHQTFNVQFLQFVLITVNTQRPSLVVLLWNLHLSGKPWLVCMAFLVSIISFTPAREQCFLFDIALHSRTSKDAGSLSAFLQWISSPSQVLPSCPTACASLTFLTLFVMPTITVSFYMEHTGPPQLTWHHCMTWLALRHRGSA